MTFSPVSPCQRLATVLISSCLLLGSTGCKVTGGASTSSSPEAVTVKPAPVGKVNEFLHIKDADTAVTIFSKIKQFDVKKSTSTSRVWEGKADVECMVDTFEGQTDTQCTMIVVHANPPAHKDYIYNFGDVDAEGYKNR